MRFFACLLALTLSLAALPLQAQEPARPKDPKEQAPPPQARPRASTLDELSYRANPQRLTAQGKAAALAFLQSTPGIALAGALGLTMTLVLALKVRNRNR